MAKLYSAFSLKNNKNPRKMKNTKKTQTLSLSNAQTLKL